MSTENFTFAPSPAATDMIEMGHYSDALSRSQGLTLLLLGVLLPSTGADTSFLGQPPKIKIKINDNNAMVRSDRLSLPSALSSVNVTQRAEDYVKWRLIHFYCRHYLTLRKYPQVAHLEQGDFRSVRATECIYLASNRNFLTLCILRRALDPTQSDSI